MNVIQFPVQFTLCRTAMRCTVGALAAIAPLPTDKRTKGLMIMMMVMMVMTMMMMTKAVITRMRVMMMMMMMKIEQGVGDSAGWLTAQCLSN